MQVKRDQLERQAGIDGRTAPTQPAPALALNGVPHAIS
jgi:hypothetical protein